MKEIINITIGGVVFSIEKPAYTKLKSYLDQIEQYFKNREAGAEITQDIESSIAEKFLARKRSLKKAITASDVEVVVEELGSVADFEEEESDEIVPKQTAARRLYRDEDNEMLGGVAAGIANYFNIDPVIPRILFVVFTFWGGFGLLAYIILWLIVPKATNASEKLASQGDPINLQGIRDYMQDKITSVPAKNIFHKIGQFLLTLGTLFVSFLEKIVPALRVILGVGLIGVSVMVLFLFSTMLMGVLFGNFDLSMDQVTAQFLAGLDVSRNEMIFLAFMIYGVFIIPTIVIFLGGIGVLFRRKTMTAWLFGVLALAWLLALSFITYKGIEMAPRIHSVVNQIEQSVEENPDHEFFLKVNDEEIYKEKVKLEEIKTIREEF